MKALRATEGLGQSGPQLRNFQHRPTGNGGERGRCAIDVRPFELKHYLIANVTRPGLKERHHATESVRFPSCKRAPVSFGGVEKARHVPGKVTFGRLCLDVAERHLTNIP